MDIQYIAPLRDAYYRMREILFGPFDWKKWFFLGFTAWLALLGSGGGISSNVGGNYSESTDAEQSYSQAMEWIQDNMTMVIVIGVSVTVFLVAIFFLIFWLQARGKFMFLDNVIHDRALVKAPWKEFKAEADSLFVWQFFLGLASTVAMLFLAGAFVLAFFPIWGLEPFISQAVAITCGAILIVVVLVLSVFQFLLSEFVVVLAYRYRCSTGEALNRFLPLLQENIISFILYFLFNIFVNIVVWTGVILLAFATCCTGFILLSIPVINVVVLLPIYVTFRLFSVNFLAQFGPEYYPLEITAPGSLPDPMDPFSSNGF